MPTAKIKLNNNNLMPAIGFGTWDIDDDQAVEVIPIALKEGYRLIDTAMIYGNEVGVGRVIVQPAIKRQDLFITTKLWNSDHGYHSARAAFEASLSRLGLDYIDLYLIHWPATEQRLSAWRAMEAIYEEGLARNIGVSNYQVEHLQEIEHQFDVVPAVNQIEFHPFNYHQQKNLLAYCLEKNIAVEAYSPLNQGQGLSDPVIVSIADSLKKTPAQVVLRWAIQHKTVPIPKAAQPDHIRRNYQVFDFELSEQDMRNINGLSLKKI